jgi:hypothetical protein
MFMVVTYIQYGLAHASSSDGLIFLDRLAIFSFLRFPEATEEARRAS